MKTIIHENVTVGENGHLHFAGIDTVTLAEKYGTPERQTKSAPLCVFPKEDMYVLPFIARSVLSL